MDFLKSVSSRLKKLDAYPKTLEDFRVKTTTGGVFSIFSISMIVILFISELKYFLTVEKKYNLVVDTSRGEFLHLHIDIDFPALNCELIGVDALDITGNAQLEITNELYRTKLDQNGAPLETNSAIRQTEKGAKVFESRHLKNSGEENYCGSCYGAEAFPGQCCNTCEDVKKAYTAKGWGIREVDRLEQCVREGVKIDLNNEYRPNEGCNIKGHIKVAKVAGNFHFAPGHTFEFMGRHMHDMSAVIGHELNLTHTIKKLAFGEEYPGVKNPLDGVSKVTEHADSMGMFEYFVKIVPTVYRYSSTKTKKKFKPKDDTVFPEENGVIRTNQYSVTEYFRPSNPAKGGRLMPGVFIFYDMSPLRVEITEEKKSFFHFIVQLCAIIGGVYTVSGMLDSTVYHGANVIKRKMQLGKAD